MSKETEETFDFSSLSFEEALLALETTVSKLEDGDLTLEDALFQYEKGQKLASYCQTYLEKAALKVEYLTEDGEIADL